jgi:uracil-DNA glycosylase
MPDAKSILALGRRGWKHVLKAAGFITPRQRHAESMKF